jgi:hypothetical protein
LYGVDSSSLVEGASKKLTPFHFAPVPYQWTVSTSNTTIVNIGPNTPNNDNNN